MKKTIRPAIFKWRQTEPELILCAVRGYLRYSLSFRDVEELLSERGLEADHTTVRLDVTIEPNLDLHAVGIFNAGITLCRRYPSGFSRSADIPAVVQVHINHHAVSIHHFELNVFHSYRPRN